MTSKLKPSPKPDTRPRCPCGSLLDGSNISNDARGRRVCAWCARQLPPDSPSPEAQRVMDAMSRESEYGMQARVAYIALGRIQPEKRQRKPRVHQVGAQQGLGI